MSDETLFEKALRRINEMWEAESENFEAARDDQKFYVGEQWNAEAKREREAAGRPVVTVNRLPSFVRQVTGDVRRDTPAIKVAPAKDGASQETADIYNGLIRNIEVQSNAKAAYVRATENACITGLGVIKVVTEYSADDAFDQDIRIRRITDPFAVLFDEAAKEPDKSDGRDCVEFVDLPKSEFQRRFPKASLESVPSGPSSGGLAWFSNESVRVAHYWYREPATKQLLLLADGRTIDAEKALKEAETGGIAAVVSKRAVECHEVKMCIISGKELLSGPHDWAGRYIPYAPVIGEETWVEGRIVRKGMVRDAKDPQRVYNYMRTAAVEAAALQPKAPFVLTADQVKGREQQWQTAGQKNHPYLVYNVDAKAPGAVPQRAQPALAQAGLDSQAMIAADELKAVPGIYDASLGAKSNETSGRAILARQREGDTGTYHFVDNLATAIRHCGRILVDLIPHIYDTERVVRVLKDDGGHEMAVVNKQEPDETGIVRRMNDLAAGEYDVTVITGPSFATRREEARESVIELVRARPEIMGAAGDIIVKNMDFPGSEEIAKRLERMVPPQVRDDMPPAPPEPDPAVMADTEKKLADAAKSRAQAEGQELKNIADGLGVMQLLEQMNQNMQTMLQTINGLKQDGGPPPESAPAMPAEPMAPPAMSEGGDVVDLEPMQAATLAATELEPMTPA